jgi:hypothetical protein
MFGLKRRQDSNIRYVQTETDDVTLNTNKILEAASTFVKNR